VDVLSSVIAMITSINFVIVYAMIASNFYRATLC